MYPEIFRIGNFSISSFGLMVAVAFAVAFYVSSKEFKRKGISLDLHGNIFLGVMVGSIIGAKLLFVFENVPIKEILANPFTHLLSRGGLTYYGGFIGGMIAFFLIVKKAKQSSWKVLDACAPALAIAYSVGRTGCFLVGDDYGIKSDLPWAIAFPDGLPPTTDTVHPTQLYEFIIMFFVFLYLWKVRKKNVQAGWLFSIYLILSGLERFFIEFIRSTTESPIPGLSIAQVTAIILIAIGIYKYTSLKKETSSNTT